ncbi:nucleotide sugar dehydrogenase [Desulfopila sp. IMCC35006]|uniref:nucleotide sugar dehydrogenase n=1 Tax=Desulfopila sp. IMCC35006 TaxID=2569542 RepID=UPI0010AC534B|nr:nucleotide sugar dehydrogenase [Desulfopila sp. IMCC35006]TKB25014.1 nucleotide sugar dehydrogenase [Desulfopila sp. IMCC35006]
MLDKTIGVVGLGYVGLPLAVTFGQKYRTIGFDIKKDAIENYRKKIDRNGEVDEAGFTAARYLQFTSEAQDLAAADFIIVAVPTPIDSANQPDLHPLTSATRTAGANMKKGATVIFESTVFPGATEDVCVPILEEMSGLTWQQDFFVGYSPERINPGDKEHTLTKITKVVSGDTPNTLQAVSQLYASILEAGVFEAASIKEAEAAKVIENTQRDLNIALVNELAIIFDRLEIDTLNVLKAAGSKWNFLPFRPGLVGGHCIGVDPYYLTWKAESVGYTPQVILSGRRINDNMGKFIAEKTVKMMLNGGVEIKSSKVGILGLTFKENCPDLRNSRVVDIIDELKSYGIPAIVYDPMVTQQQALEYAGVELAKLQDLHDLGAVIIAVPHRQFAELSVQYFIDTLKPGGCIIDVKSMLDMEEMQNKDVNFWRL